MYIEMLTPMVFWLSHKHMILFYKNGKESRNFTTSITIYDVKRLASIQIFSIKIQIQRKFL